MTVRFASDLRRHSDRPALIDGAASLTYAELAGLVAQRSEQFGGDRRLVLLAGSNRMDAVIWYLAALAGGHPVLLANARSIDAVASLVANYDPDVVIGPSRESGGTWTLTERRRGSCHDLHPDLALLLSTSGSTGSQKLARLSADNLQSNAEAIVEYLGIGPQDRAITSLPMAYCYGLSVINSHLAAGASVVLTERSVVEPAFWELAGATGVTSFAGVPYTFDLLDRVGFAEMDLPTLRYVTQAGGRLAPDRVRAYAELGRRRGWRLFVMYGQTEATARMAFLPPDLATDHPESIGVPIPGGVLDIESVADAPDAVGELVYRGPNVMLGYAHHASDLAAGRTVHELRTGDLGRLTDDGLYEIVGRRESWLKVAGLRIDTQRVEQLLDGAARASAVVGNDEGLIVAVEGARDPSRLARDLSGRIGLPSEAVMVHVVDELPRLANGKVDRAAVAALGSARVAVDERERPTPPAAAIRTLYADALGSHPGADDTFAGLGGDSLSYIHVSLGLEGILGRLPDAWQSMTVRELGALAESERDGREPVGSSIAKRLGRWRSIEASVALRALAILLIVSQHADLMAVMGGAHLLMAVAGFNFARFQLTDVPRRDRLRSQIRSVARVVVPSAVWIAAMLLVTNHYALTNLFFLNAIVGSTEWSSERQFWFLELLVYILITMACLTAIPAVDRLERRWPLALGAVVLAVGLGTRFELVEPLLVNTRPPVLWLFALGWLATRARIGWQRGAVVAITVVAMPGYFGDPSREAVVAGGIAFLTLVPSVRCPDLVARVAAVLASASLYIYLVHWQIYPALETRSPFLAVVASLAAGVLAWVIAMNAPRAAGRLRVLGPLTDAGWLRPRRPRVAMPWLGLLPRG